MRAAWTLLLGAMLVITPAAQALPTPGLFGEEARTATGRLFPEAMETNDFVSYNEAVENLKLLEEENPDLLEYQEAGTSLGWDNIAGGHDSFEVPVVTVTDETSDVPMDDRVTILFQLSIHANEKGGREGGVRVIEDFTKAANGEEDRGIATEERLGMLEYTRLVFLFHNPDGWTHEEAEYRHNDGGAISYAGAETQNFIRGNGNGTDLNRQAPTQGWSRGEGDHAALSEPSTQDVIPWLEEEFEEIHFATDIHGMLYPANALVNSSRPIQCFPPSEAPDNPVEDEAGEVCLREGNFVLTMLPAAQMTDKEMHLTTELAEKLKQRMNSDPYFAEWNTMPGAGAWGGDYNGWGTVWDTIGYVDSGFHSDWFAQDTGLDAPGVDFEYSYNHITFDNYYPGLAQRINDYHVHTTRIIVGTFMDIAAQHTDVSVDTGETRTAWVPSDVYATSEDNGELSRWAAENPADDKWDWAHGGGYNASINQYFEDRGKAIATDGEQALFEASPEALADQLDAEEVDNLVVPGSAARQIVDDPDAVSAIKAFIEEGGHLVLTDEALGLLAPLGVVDESAITERTAYAGYTNWDDRSHELADGVRGLSRQLFEPMPLGFSIAANDGQGSSPIWVVERSAFEDAGGETVGTLGPKQVNLGQVTLGEGEITMVGALLPDPSEDFYHPYGLASYATTYTGNQVMRNALGWELTVDSMPRDQGDNLTLPEDEDGEGIEGQSTDANDTPFPGPLGALAALGAALVLVRRRRGAP